MKKNNHLLPGSSVGWNCSTGSTNPCVVSTSVWHGNGTTQRAPKTLRCSSCGLCLCAGETFTHNHQTTAAHSNIFIDKKEKKKKITNTLEQEMTLGSLWCHLKLAKDKRLFTKIPVQWHLLPHILNHPGGLAVNGRSCREVLWARQHILSQLDVNSVRKQSSS